MPTQREKMLAEYAEYSAKSGIAFRQTTRPLVSTVPFLGVVTNPFAVSSALEGTAFLVFPEGQVQEAFSYGVGGQRPTGLNALLGPVTKTATPADTNISKGRSTNGAEDFVIESMSASNSSLYTALRTVNGSLADDTGTAITGCPVTDPAVISAIAGAIPFSDPASIISPPQVYSPLNLEAAIYEALAPHIAVEFAWNRRRVEAIGSLDQLGEGAGKSYLRSHGSPDPANRYRVPEGYIWRRDGQPDSDFVVKLSLSQTVVFCINKAAAGTSGNPAVNLFVGANAVALDVRVRLHGCSFDMPSTN